MWYLKPVPSEQRPPAIPALSIAAVYLIAQVPIIALSVSPTRDGARYIRYALRLESEPSREVFRSSVDHPGYPVLLAAAFAAGRAAGLDAPAERVLLAQAATSLAGLAFVLLAFAVARRLWGTGPAWAAAVSLAALPRPAWAFADVLSDPLHAALWMASALAFLRALEGRSPRAALLAGLLAGLAYWVRVDALALAAASLFTLAILGLARAPRRRLDRGTLLAAACHAAGFGAALAAFVAACGRLSTKPVSELLLGSPAPGPAAPFVAAGSLAGATDLARAAWQVLESLGQEVQVAHLLTAAIGLAVLRRPRPRPEALFVLAALAITGIVHVAVAWKAGYFSGRYFLPVLPLVIGFGMAGVQRFSLLWAERRRAAGRRVARRPGWIGLGAAIAASLAVSLPSLLGRRLHENEHGVIQAGRWVAARAAGADTVRDPRFFPSYLAGIGGRAVAVDVPAEPAGRHFIIAEEEDLAERKGLARAVDEGKARLAAEFPGRRDGTGGRARVYVIGGE